MPDLLSHICFAYILVTIFKIKENRVIVYVGAVLPDLFKLFILFVPFMGELKAINFFFPLHTTLGVLLTGAFVSGFFDIEWKRAYKLILLGAFSHLFLDSLMWPFGVNLWFFYPFFIFHMNGIIWPDSVIPVIILVSVSIIYMGAKKYKVRKCIQRIS